MLDFEQSQNNQAIVCLFVFFDVREFLRDQKKSINERKMIGR